MVSGDKLDPHEAKETKLATLSKVEIYNPLIIAELPNGVVIGLGGETCDCSGGGKLLSLTVGIVAHTILHLCMEGVCEREKTSDLCFRPH